MSAERQAASHLLTEVVEMVVFGELDATPGERAFLAGVIAVLADRQPMVNGRAPSPV